MRARADDLHQRVEARLAEAGASIPSCQAAARAMMHASSLGIDSHGVRLTEHYCNMLRSGRINGKPVLKVERRAAAAATVDADDGLGHYAAYHAVEVAADMAEEAGTACVAVARSSHFGAAGAYADAGARRGVVCFVTSNADSIVAPFDGTEPFHGTNPHAWAAPVEGADPWLFDMATSSIPMNRVLLYRTLGRELPKGVAADEGGVPTRDPHSAAMLLPLGGTEYGFKGAGLAGVATILSAVLTGMTLDHDMIGMTDPNNTDTPRRIGHAVIAIKPSFFAGDVDYGAGMQRYLAALRGARAREGARVLVPGDRERQVRAEREAEGIPLDPGTAAFLGFA
jgi:ureidoglycolate dehydrogenase (NAD+)